MICKMCMGVGWTEHQDGQRFTYCPHCMGIDPMGFNGPGIKKDCLREWRRLYNNLPWYMRLIPRYILWAIYRNGFCDGVEAVAKIQEAVILEGVRDGTVEPTPPAEMPQHPNFV